MSSSAPKGVELQPRDLHLLRDLFVSRLMTLAQASAIHFAGKAEMAKKRVQKLKAAGVIAVRVRKAYEPSVLYLTRAGYDALRQRGLLAEFPAFPWRAVEQRLAVSDLTLRHELDVMSVKAAFFSAVCGDPSLRIEEFTTWPLLNQFHSSLRNGSDIVVKPDGFLRIRQQQEEESFEHVFYLELDRSTETLGTLASKAQAYLAHYQSGGLAERFGRERSEYKDFPFRVLMIFKTAERRNNVAERLLTGTPPVLTHTWLTTFDHVVTQPFSAIWVRPRDYRDAVSGSALAIARPQREPVYRRQSEREYFVESKVCHQRLLDTGVHNDG